jgi:hypothetical protein
MEEEPRAELPTLPFNELPAISRGTTQEKRVEASFRQLRYRCHRYHGVTRAKATVTQHAVDAAASELGREAIRFTHALKAAPKYDPADPDAPCACIYCV